jgi:hypothetical protein
MKRKILAPTHFQASLDNKKPPSFETQGLGISLPRAFYTAMEVNFISSEEVQVQL